MAVLNRIVRECPWASSPGSLCGLQNAVGSAKFLINGAPAPVGSMGHFPAALTGHLGLDPGQQIKIWLHRGSAAT